jgi:hypothetical protein
MHSLIWCKTAGRPLFMAGVLACLGLVSGTQAVMPPPDGGYPGGNTAEGQGALFSLTTGGYNTAVGFLSLRSDTTGQFNTAVGAGALLANTGNNNTATGAGALLSNTGGNNTAIGAFALFSNVGPGNNTAVGANALFHNTGTGTFNTENTATGANALFSNTIGVGNTATGAFALYRNASGNSNTAVGDAALFNNTTQSSNTAVGYGALDNSTGDGNTALGYNAGMNATTGDGNVYIGVGMQGVAGESNACYIKSIFGQTSANGGQVFVNSNNKLGTLTSSKRFKEDIKPMEKASEVVFALKPVAFRYKREIDPTGTSQFGLVAEDVEKVNPNLVVRDKEGKPYNVRYDQVNAMLLNEFLKEHRKNEEQQAIIMQLKSTDAKQEAIIAQQQKQIDALTAGLQKVSAQFELSKTAPQTVLNIH